MFDYYVCGVDIILSDVFVRSAVNVILCYFMIGTVFWVPISFYVCWFMRVNDFEIDDRLSVRSLYYLAAILLWPFVLKAGADVAFDGLYDWKKNND